LLHRTFLKLKKRRRTRWLFDGSCLPQTDPADLPRRIYLFWDKGFDAAPDLCKTCLASWRARNPEWDFVLLDRDLADRILPWKTLPSTISFAAYSDLLRTRLLLGEGGVWADATVLCLKPLDMWLPQIFAQTDFFAFSRPGPDRVLSSWFLAAAPDAALLRRWQDACERLWHPDAQLENPYFWYHHTFEYLLMRSRAHRKAWKAVPRMSALPLHRLQRCLEKDTFTASDRATIKASPMQKLTYKNTQVTSRLSGALAELGI